MAQSNHRLGDEILRHKIEWVMKVYVGCTSILIFIIFQPFSTSAIIIMMKNNFNGNSSMHQLAG